MTQARADKLKILMAGPDRSVHGGISAVVNSYYEAGLDDMTDLKYIGTMKEGSKPYKLFVAAMAYIRFRMNLKWADIVHVHMASDNSFRRKSFFIRAAHKHGKRIIIHQHGGDLAGWVASGGPDRQAGVIEVLNMADEIIVISDAYRDIISGFSHNGEKVHPDIHVMPNAIDISRYEYTGHADTDHRILFLGRICRDKGVSELISAVSHLSGIYPDIRLVLGGIWEDADLREEMRSAGEHVEYAGWLGGADKAGALSECSVFALPSYFEGQSVSVLEAMASGCLVVASDTGGIPMMVKDGETGILVSPRDAGSLEEALRRALSADLHAEHVRMREAARDMVHSEFNMVDYMKKLMQLYVVQ